MQFDIRNRYTESVLFTAEIACAEDAPASVKIGSAVIWAAMTGANLRRANLRRADLSGANLSSANLREADLRGAVIKLAIGDMRVIHSSQIECWRMAWTSEVLAIGRKQHPISEWKKFSDREISDMDDDALTFWKKWKSTIFKMVELSVGGR